MLVSNFIDETLEAYAVLVYVNNYYKWVKQHGIQKGGDNQSSVTPCTETSLFNGSFTAEARGAASYEGWSVAGKIAYNVILETIDQQRDEISTGGQLEQALLRDLIAESTGRKRRSNGKYQHRRVKVKNRLEKLLDELDVQPVDGATPPGR